MSAKRSQVSRRNEPRLAIRCVGGPKHNQFVFQTGFPTLGFHVIERGDGTEPVWDPDINNNPTDPTLRFGHYSLHWLFTAYKTRYFEYVYEKITDDDAYSATFINEFVRKTLSEVS
jgi:hypothetical protein